LHKIYKKVGLYQNYFSMRILIAFDKFKYTFSAEEITHIVAQLLDSDKYTIWEVPLSDGGEGFLDVIKRYVSAQFIELKTYNAILEVITAPVLVAGRVAFIECANTCGIANLPADKRNPLFTTSFGLGIQIKKLLESEGVSEFYIGLGGSATHDVGIGMAAALGYRFIDVYKRELKPIGKNLIEINHIVFPKSFPSGVKFTGVCDVRNPLLGENGAAYTFAQQKGAREYEIQLLEKGTKNISEKIRQYLKQNIGYGAFEGAAGGLGAGIKAFLRGKLISGAQFVFKLADIEHKIKNADVIITGEGRLDKTSFKGKLTGEIYKLAVKYHKKLIVICGSLYGDIDLPNLEIYPLFYEKVPISIAKKLTPQRIKLVMNNIFK